LYLKLPDVVSYEGATIEVGIRPTPLRVTGRRNVTLRNFAVMRNRGAVQETGFLVTNSRNITLDGITVKWMAYSAWGGSRNTTIRIYRSVFSDNGVLAVSSYMDVDVIVEDSEVARNNWRGSAVGHVGWESVFKWAGVHDGIVRRTQFIDNRGNGFWLDTDNQRVTIERSLLSGQVLKGISLENNPGPITISDNRICNNTQAGVGDAQSNNVTLRNNQIFANTGWNIIFTGVYSGQTSQDWQTGLTSTNRSLFWVVEGNVIAGSGTDGWLWWHTDYKVPGAWALVRNTMVIDNNIWYHTGRTTAFKLPQGSAAYTAFQGDLRLANPEWEAQGAWRDPGPLSCTMPE
jgi:Right handed beta helix region